MTDRPAGATADTTGPPPPDPPATARAALERIAPAGDDYRLVYRDQAGVQTIVRTSDPAEALLAAAPAGAETVRVDLAGSAGFRPLTPPFQLPDPQGLPRLPLPIDPEGWPVRVRIVAGPARTPVFDAAGYASVAVSVADLDRETDHSCILHHWSPGANRWSPGERLGRLEVGAGWLTSISRKTEALAAGFVRAVQDGRGLDALAGALSSADREDVAAAAAEAIRRLPGPFEGTPLRLRELWTLAQARSHQRPLAEAIAWVALGRARALVASGGGPSLPAHGEALLSAVDKAYPGTTVLARERERLHGDTARAEGMPG